MGDNVWASRAAVNFPTKTFVRLLVVFFAVNACTWVAAIAYHLIRFKFGGVAPLVLVDPIGHSADFMVYNGLFQVLHRQEFFNPSYDRNSTYPWAYPAAAALLYRPFYLFQHHGLRYFLAFNAAAVLGVHLLFARTLCRSGLRVATSVAACVCALLVSFPFWFAFQQANIELLLWLLLTLGICAYWKGMWNIAAVAFGLAAAVKIYPITLLGLLFSKGRYKSFALGVAAAVLADVGANIWLGPTYAIARRGISAGLLFMQQNSEQHAPWLEPFDHSLFALVKLCFRPFADTFATHLSIYMVFIAVAGLLLFFLRVRRLPRTNQVCFMVCYMLLAPPTSLDYTLIHLSAVLAVLSLAVLSPGGRQDSPTGLGAAFVMLALVTGNLSFVRWLSADHAAQVKCLLLIGLIGVALTCPFEELQGHSRKESVIRRKSRLQPAKASGVSCTSKCANAGGNLDSRGILTG